MTDPEQGSEPEIRAVASAWVARLHSDECCEEDRAAFKTWLAEDDRHREAFDRVTTIWETTGNLDRYRLATARPPRASQGKSLARRAVCAGIFLAIAAGLAPWWGFSWWQFHSVETYITQVGEQLRVPLSDGSVAILDTNTIVNVEFGGVIREVELVRGRVYFDVAPNHERPFIVRVDARRVVALGTAFDVQRGNDSLRVVLVRGRIAVERNNSTFDPGAIELASPGEFATLTEDGELERGQLELGKATAWQSGRIVFKEDSLRDAVAEMNRYSRQPIALGDATVGDLLISAVYEVSNADSFAKSLSMLLPVSVTYEEGIAVLRRSPEENSTPPR